MVIDNKGLTRAQVLCALYIYALESIRATLEDNSETNLARLNEINMLVTNDSEKEIYNTLSLKIDNSARINLGHIWLGDSECFDSTAFDKLYGENAGFLAIANYRTICSIEDDEQAEAPFSPGSSTSASSAAPGSSLSPRRSLLGKFRSLSFSTPAIALYPSRKNGLVPIVAAPSGSAGSSVANSRATTPQPLIGAKSGRLSPTTPTTPRADQAPEASRLKRKSTLASP